MVDRPRPMRMRGLPCAALLLLWLSHAAFACTTNTGSQPAQGAGGGGSTAALDASISAGSAGLPSSEPLAGMGGAAALDSGSASQDSSVAGAPIDAAMAPVDAAADAAPTGPSDAAQPPPDAAVEAGPPLSSFCPLGLPEFDTPCFREGLSCTYGMECCPDLAFCEYGRWTLLTHHCDACVDGMPQ